MYRNKEGLGVWEHRGKVAAVGIGHSPTARRWDETPETSLGAWSILALRNAMEDAGVSPDQVDGLVISPGSLGEPWSPRPIPEDFASTFQLTDNPNDGLSQMSAEFVLKNMPELTNVNFTMYGPGCMSNAICVAAQAIGDGLTQTCLVLTGRNNLAGRYGQYGANAADTVSGAGQFTAPWGPHGAHRGRPQLLPVPAQVQRQEGDVRPLRRQREAQRPHVPGGLLRTAQAGRGCHH